MNTEQFTSTRVSFPHQQKMSTQTILEHLHNYQYPCNREEAEAFIQNYKPQVLENYEELLTHNNFIIEYSPDLFYFGISIDTKKTGIGVLYKKSKSIYEGSWKENLKNGRGLEIFNNGSFYDGQYINGKPDGVGTYQWNNGETYEGQWIKGKKHGSGIWKGSKGDSYIGEWNEGIAEGYGVHQWINGDRYEGEFKNCLKDGYGTEKFANGDTYMGQYSKGKPNGQGEYYWVNGAVYKGEFKDGLRSGKGLWKRGNGLSDSYDGEYVNDLKSGYGVYCWADGNRYEGYFRNDLREGIGTMFWNDGTFYKGQWKSGIQDGEGMLSMNQEVVKGVFYGTKIIEVQENTSFRAQSYQPTQRQQSQQSRQTSYSTDRERLYSEFTRQMQKLKNTTENSTKVDSFTQTNRDSGLFEQIGKNNQQKHRITQSKLIHNLHKPMHFPGLKKIEQQNKNQIPTSRPKRLWRPSGVVSSGKQF